MKRILFIGHDANRSGAQLLLLDLLKFIKNKSIFDFELLLRNDGELLPEFEKVATTYLWNKNKPIKHRLNFIPALYGKLRKRLLINRLKRRKFDLIYCNTITNGVLLKELAVLGIPVITHVHELNYWTDYYGKDNLVPVKKYTTKYIAVSEAVKVNLVNKLGIDESKIELINEFIDFEKITRIQKQNNLRNLLNLSGNTVLIGACGFESWRKGKDLFIPVAIQVLAKTDKDIHFVWIGGKVSYELEFDLKRSGFSERIHFINHLPDANSYFNDLSIFLMLSREDPFPVVNLEVAAFGKPILCFKNSGGTTELLGSLNELVSDYLNIEELSGKILEIINNEERRNKTGELLRAKVKEHYDINIIASKIITLINSLL
jgi:glycosyltransferase involved in cell wall biosynthesis